MLKDCDEAGENCVSLVSIDTSGGPEEIRLGTVTTVVCGGTAELNFLDNLAPGPGDVDFYLVRESTPAPVDDYGPDSGARPRFPDAGDCPALP